MVDLDGVKKISKVVVTNDSTDVGYTISCSANGIDWTEIEADKLSEETDYYTGKITKESVNPYIMPVTIPTMPSFRMTRRLSGAYELDESEEGRDFDDTIGNTGDWRKHGPVFSIPYRCLYGKRIDNLLTAGRCISVTTSMWDITRAIPTCALTGEAAGTAAAMAAAGEGSVSRLDVKALQSKLPIKK